jgi:NADH-quinone oxidoreductase subunit N
MFVNSAHLGAIRRSRSSASRWRSAVLLQTRHLPLPFLDPDVYQGASNETAGYIASLPKVGAVAVLVRLVSLATPDNHTIVMLLTALAILSMCYGNLIALVQKDFKRLLGFSGIAHAGYAVVGFTATQYWLHRLPVLHRRIHADGHRLLRGDLPRFARRHQCRHRRARRLHRRSPLLAVTLIVGVFGLAGIPPFVGFIGKLRPAHRRPRPRTPRSRHHHRDQHRDRDLLLPAGRA